MPTKSTVLLASVAWMAGIASAQDARTVLETAARGSLRFWEATPRLCHEFDGSLHLRSMFGDAEGG